MMRLLVELLLTVALLLVAHSTPVIISTGGSVTITPANINLGPMPATNRVTEMPTLDNLSLTGNGVDVPWSSFSMKYWCKNADGTELVSARGQCSDLFDGSPTDGVPSDLDSVHVCFPQGAYIEFDFELPRAITSVMLDAYCNTNLAPTYARNPGHWLREAKISTSSDGSSWTTVFWADDIMPSGASCDRVELTIQPAPIFARFLRFVMQSGGGSTCLHQVALYAEQVKMNPSDLSLDLVNSADFDLAELPPPHLNLMTETSPAPEFSCQEPHKSYSDRCEDLFDGVSSSTSFMCINDGGGVVIDFGGGVQNIQKSVTQVVIKNYCVNNSHNLKRLIFESSNDGRRWFNIGLVENLLGNQCDSLRVSMKRPNPGRWLRIRGWSAWGGWDHWCSHEISIFGGAPQLEPALTMLSPQAAPPSFTWTSVAEPRALPIAPANLLGGPRPLSADHYETGGLHPSYSGASLVDGHTMAPVEFDSNALGTTFMCAYDTVGYFTQIFQTDPVILEAVSFRQYCRNNNHGIANFTLEVSQDNSVWTTVLEVRDFANTTFSDRACDLWRFNLGEPVRAAFARFSATSIYNSWAAGHTVTAHTDYWCLDELAFVGRPTSVDSVLREVSLLSAPQKSQFVSATCAVNERSTRRWCSLRKA